MSFLKNTDNVCGKQAIAMTYTLIYKQLLLFTTRSVISNTNRENQK